MTREQHSHLSGYLSGNLIPDSFFPLFLHLRIVNTASTACPVTCSPHRYCCLLAPALRTSNSSLGLQPPSSTSPYADLLEPQIRECDSPSQELFTGPYGTTLPKEFLGARGFGGTPLEALHRAHWFSYSLSSGRLTAGLSILTAELPLE